MANNMKITGSGGAGASSQTVGNWSGTSRDGSDGDDNATGYDQNAPVIAPRNPVNMSNHKRSPLS